MADLMIDEARADEYKSLAKIAKEVFMDDRFYKAMIPDPARRARRLFKIYLQGAKICLKNEGGVLAVKKNSEPVGFLMYFDYNKFRQRNLRGFLKIFDGKIHKNKISPPAFEKIHRQVVQLKSNPVFVLAIAVAEKHQNQGIGTALFEHFLNKFADRKIISDVSGPFFRKICLDEGFEVKPLSETCELVIK